MKKITLFLLCIMLGIGAFAQTTRYWSGESTTTDNISDGTNWWGKVNPNSGDHLVFDHTNGRHWASSNYAIGSWFGTIIIKEGAGSIKFLGDNTYAYKFENNSENELFEINNNIIGNRIGSNLEINPVGTGGILVSGSFITLDGARILHFNGANTATINGEIKEINGTSSVYVHDSKVILKSASTYTGTTTIDNLGVLEIQKNLASSTITVKSGAKLIVNGLSITINNLTIDAGGTVEVAAGKSLTVNGTLTNNGTLNLLSDVNGTATILTKGTVTNGGTTNYNVQQYLSSYRTWYMSSPVSGTVTPGGGGASKIKYFNETVAGNVWNEVTAMTAKTGYLLVPSTTTGPSTITFKGTLNTGNQSIPLTRSVANTEKPGYNLIGNPYPSYLDWKLVAANTSNAAIMPTATMWYRTKVGAAYTFWTVNGDGIGTPSTASKNIPPMQAFWVRTIAGGGNLALTNDMRLHESVTTNLLKAPAAKNSELQLIRLQVSNGINTDETVLYVSDKASNGFDVYDSPKMSNDDPAISEIYTTLNSEHIVINAMNSLPLNTEIGLGFTAGTATSFSIRANEVSNLPQDVTLVLKDNASGTETDLTDCVTAYSFAPAETTGDRFSIILRKVSAAVETAAGNGITVYSSKNGINITVNSELNENASVSVFNAVGQQLVNQHLTKSATTVKGNFNPGIYVVKVSNGTAATATQKIVIK